jgi:hypothetical protein
MTRSLAARWGLLGLIAVGATGCSTVNNTERGALAGGAIGAGAGTLVGAATGNPKTGAVVGGLIGAGVGGIVGNEEDRKDRREAREQQVAATQAYADAQPQRINEIIDLARAGHSEQVIINHIRANSMTFVLGSADLNTLKSNGVPDRVILEMQTPQRSVAVAPPRYRQREVVYVADPYCGPPPPVVFVRPPPPVVGVGFTYRR